MKYKNLFSPLKIGSVLIKNRIVMEPATTALCALGGKATNESLCYYTRRAEGGVGLIILEILAVDSQTGLQLPNEFRADCDDVIPELKKYSESIHNAGGRIFAQLNHPGHDVDPSNVVVPCLSASSIPSPHRKTPTRAMTIDEIHEMVEKFAQAALRVKKAGLDGVEIHAAHHYLIHQFLSPVTNIRTDEYGGTLENRARFLVEIIQRTKEICGQDFPVMVRISVEEYVGKNGYHIDQGIKICQMAESAGADCIDVSASGAKSHGSQSVEPASFEQGWRKHLAKAVKEAVKVPVCMVSVVRDPDYADMLIEQGFTDFVGSARSHIADPDWSNKALAGEESEIIHCISCMRCFESLMEPEIRHIRCSLNPKTGYEAAQQKIILDGAKRKVVVLGAGPGGMQAAITAADRGFDVTLCEKSSQTGGQSYYGSLIDRKPHMKKMITDMENRALSRGVNIIKNFAPTIDDLKEMCPYAIIDATGGEPQIPSYIEGANDSKIVCTPIDILSGKIVPQNEGIIIIGSGLTGLETAEYILSQHNGNAINIVEMDKRIAPGAIGSNRNDVVDFLELNQVNFILNRKCTGIDDNAVYLQDVNTHESYMIPCDRVIISVGVRPSNPYQGELEKTFEKVIKIGDANAAGRILEAIRTGYYASTDQL